ncbi:hypothetical protein [Cryobacterium sp. Hh7]|nr:hypothetical protein [Cryobacterium sp. Hh7]
MKMLITKLLLGLASLVAVSANGGSIAVSMAGITGTVTVNTPK